MAINSTTLSGAVAVSDNSVGVASATGISAPTPQTGAGVTLLKIDDEMMYVVSLIGTQVQVLRGQYGTQQTAHELSAPVLIGAPSDFPNFVPTQGVSAQKLPYNYSAVGAPLAITSNTIAPLYGYIHHVTGTTVLKTITVPAGTVSGGKVTLVFDGWYWSDLGRYREHCGSRHGNHGGKRGRFLL